MSGNSNPEFRTDLGACGVDRHITTPRRPHRVVLTGRLKTGHAPSRNAGGLDPAYSCEEAQTGTQRTRLAGRPYQIEVTP